MAVGEATQHGTVLFEVRVGLGRTDTWSMAAAVLGCLLLIPYAFARNSEGGLRENLLSVGLTYLVVLAVVVLILVRLRGMVRVTETHVIRTRMLRGDVVIPRHQIAEAVVTRRYAVPGAGGPRAFLLDHEGETLLTFQPLRELADVEVLEQVAPQVTEVPVLVPAEATARWPRMLPGRMPTPPRGRSWGRASSWPSSSSAS
ncbi:hypothetical protein [Ornithinimicrobium murale]|uniref:hypothetical protein n=1 Tax=Ornithinimicrobium murale TaxID=1050153 RepID=UPI000E0D419B|nr:hypothetical protein [Ornithinimicrobium murale]